MEETNATKAIVIDESDDESYGTEAGSDVHLGFIDRKTKNLLFNDPDWRTWDGGKVGGKPVWLNPVQLPLSQSIECEQCRKPMSFVLQIYCPVDDTPSGFHRALYLFCCKSRECLRMGNVKCLRTQLARANPYYSYDPAVSHTKSNTEPGATAPTLCALCGCIGTMLCSQCKVVHYCSKAHQKDHWKRHKLQCGTTTTVFDTIVAQEVETQILGRNLFPEYSLQVEEEVFEEDDEEEMKKIMETANIWEDAVTEGGADEEADARLTQADYQRAMGSEVHDPTYINFLTRVERGGRDQVLRYCRTIPPITSESAEAEPSSDVKENALRGGRSSKGLLLLSSDAELLKSRTATVHANPCPHCGAPRIFECQVMPQLLHFLKVDSLTSLATPPVPSQAASDAVVGDAGVDAAGVAAVRAFVNKTDKDIDWGSLDVFTCSASCDAQQGSSAYVEELVLLQPPVYKDN